MNSDQTVLIASAILLCSPYFLVALMGGLFFVLAISAIKAD